MNGTLMRLVFPVYKSAANVRIIHVVEGLAHFGLASHAAISELAPFVEDVAEPELCLISEAPLELSHSYAFMFVISSILLSSIALDHVECRLSVDIPYALHEYSDAISH